MCLNTLPLYFFIIFPTTFTVFLYCLLIKSILLVIYAPVNMCSVSHDYKGRQYSSMPLLRLTIYNLPEVIWGENEESMFIVVNFFPFTQGYCRSYQAHPCPQIIQFTGLEGPYNLHFPYTCLSVSLNLCKVFSHRTTLSLWQIPQHALPPTKPFKDPGLLKNKLR